MMRKSLSPTRSAVASKGKTKDVLGRKDAGGGEGDGPPPPPPGLQRMVHRTRESSLHIG